jgi:hypothetical protein
MPTNKTPENLPSKDIAAVEAVTGKDDAALQAATVEGSPTTKNDTSINKAPTAEDKKLGEEQRKEDEKIAEQVAPNATSIPSSPPPSFDGPAEMPVPREVPAQYTAWAAPEHRENEESQPVYYGLTLTAPPIPPARVENCTRTNFF